MGEGIGLHAIDADPEPAQFPIEFVVGDVVGDERFEHLVEVAEVDGVGGDARNVRVHDLEERQRVVEIGRWRQLEEVEPLPHGQLVVGQHVAGRVGGVALEHVADDPLVERLSARLRQRGVRDRLAGQCGQAAQLLVVAERTVGHQLGGARLELGHLHASTVRVPAAPGEGPKTLSRRCASTLDGDRMDVDLHSPRPPWRPRAFLRWLWQLTKDVVDEYRQDGVGDLAASITFWTILSIPAAALSLVSTLSSLGSLVGQSLADDVQREIESFVESTFTDDAALNETVRELFDTPSRGVATVATVVALYTLSRAFAGLIRALDVAYEVDDGRPWWYVRIVAIGLGIGTVSIVAAGATSLALLPSLALSGAAGLLTPVAVVVGLVLWAACLFHVGPNHKTPWRYDLPGAVLTATGWIIATQGFAVYVRIAPSGNEIQTSVGAILLALTLMYLLSVVLLLGAELNDVLARRAGVVQLPPPVTTRARNTIDRWRARRGTG